MMDDEINEALAQLRHENLKLQDELNHLKEQTLSTEESLNSACHNLTIKENHIKSLEQQINCIFQTLKEKEHIIESLELGNENLRQINQRLSAENYSLKEELTRTKQKSEEVDLLKGKEVELKNAYNKIRLENCGLRSEVLGKSEELSLMSSTIKNLQHQVKELEDEKAELMTMRDTLLCREEKQLKTSENSEWFLRKSSEWSKFQMNLTGQGDQELSPNSFKKEGGDINLREEILEVEIRENRLKIENLESSLQKKEEEQSEVKNLISELRQKLDNIGLLPGDSKVDATLDSSAFYNIYTHLLKLLNWPEGQPGEVKPLTEVTSLAVVVKDGVQTTQPGSIRIVETISIASQTDPIKNLSPVSSLFRTFEKYNSNDSSDSDDDGGGGGPLAFMDQNEVRQGFLEHKNCDLDMDIYKSCRKLSVLPEEENDDTFNRKSSFKNHTNPKCKNVKMKTHSADDVSKFRINPPVKKTFSCSNIIIKSFNDSFGDFSLGKATDNHFKADCKLQNNELNLSILSQRDALSQPRSFDSYLDPLQTHNVFLARQISDPTQNTVFAPPITRRGSYLRKPRSTCRPLTLPCDKDDRKKEERVCKVRFDLSGIAPKTSESPKENKEHNPPSILNKNDKVKIVSRFRVEIVDEVEFRNSLEENNATVTRKRPPLIHSVMYKKAVLRDVTNEVPSNDASKQKSHSLESPDSPTYDTATEGSPAESIDVDSFGSNFPINEPYPCKRRKHSDSSCYSFEDSQDSSEGNDIIIKSIKLHTNSQCIIMKDVSRESSDSSNSNIDSEIPYIDAEDLPVIKPSPEILKIIPVVAAPLMESNQSSVEIVSPGSPSEGSDPYLTPCDVTPVNEGTEATSLGVQKSIGLSKSPTVLKNLANFELLTTITESSRGRKLMQTEIIEEEEDERKLAEEEQKRGTAPSSVENHGGLKRTSSDISEASESDTLTYDTVRSHLLPSSDGDSDTYVTIWSDKSSSAMERKFSDFSENSSSPYNTPPDTSSASFCTPPDTYSPILNLLKKYPGLSGDRSQRSSESYSLDNKWEEFGENYNFNSPSASPPLCQPNKVNHDNGQSSSGGNSARFDIMFDSPKLEFYETNDSVENLEAFLKTEEGLSEQVPKEVARREGGSNLENLGEGRFFETEEEFREALSKRNSLESPKLSERRGKKHPPLSRQNSTEEYNFLEPHDSCLNLSEEISSPSTTPDTSNKTVIFKNIPLTVSNTIDLEDEDFPISETEIQVNFNGSQTEILEIPLRGEIALPGIESREDVPCCRSEPCTPSMSSSSDFPEFSVVRKQRSSFTDESLMCKKFEGSLPAPPEIIVSNLSSESENSDSEVPGCAGTDFASNVSDRSEVHLSDVNSISGHSDNCGSLSDHSDNVVSDVFTSDSDKSSAISPEVSQNSSSPQSCEKTPPIEDFLADDLPHSSDEIHLDNPGDREKLEFCHPNEETTEDFTTQGLEVSGGFHNPATLTDKRVRKVKMSKPSESSVSDTDAVGEGFSLELSEGSSVSDRDSNNSRDVNLNSKKFADCNLLGTGRDRNTQIPRGEVSNMKSSSECGECRGTEAVRKEEKLGLSQENNAGPGNSPILRKKSIAMANSSTPKPESAGTHVMCDLFSISPDGSTVDPENSGQTYLVSASPINPSSSLTNEEIGQKFQDLSFAFKTDSMTIQNRLHLMKRRRDQAETNIENELKTIKAKLKSLQYLGLNSEFVNLMSDLKKQLDFVLNATVQLSSSAEGYGYAQHEERLLELVTVMLQHVENVETLKNEESKILEKLKAEGKRTAISLDGEGDGDDKVLRRRSVAGVASEIASRRRASIATLPRIPPSASENSVEGKPPQWGLSNRPLGVAKKLSFSQTSSPRSNSSPTAGEDSRRDSSGRLRTEGRTTEGLMKNIDESPEQRSSATELDSSEEATDADNTNTDLMDSSLQLRQLFESLEEIRQNSISQESTNAIYCLRRIIEWNKLLISATRFRWPDNVLHYVPFYITWYVVFVLALVFVGGLFTGINGCYTYSCWKHSLLWLLALTFLCLTRRFYRFVLPLFFALLLALTLLFLWLTEIFLPQLSNEDFEKLVRKLGFALEIRYPHGPPPV